MSSSIRQMYRCFSFLVSLYRVSRFAVLPFTLTRSEQSFACLKELCHEVGVNAWIQINPEFMIVNGMHVLF